MSFREIVKAAEMIDGWMSADELEWLASQASTRKIIIEIGSWKGRSTKALAMATRGTVFAVDHWRGSPSERKTSHKEAVDLGQDAMFETFKRNLNWEIEFGRVIPILSESADAPREISPILEARGEPVDMVFIDGDHTRRAALSDILTFAPLVRPGGIVCGHDYSSGCRDVVDAVHQALGRPHGVSGSIWFHQR